LKTITLEPTEQDSINSTKISHILGNISFKKVNFEYKKNNQVLKNINLEVKKGQVTAFVGASGAGKSTMLALILKFITPNNGEILIDDKNLKLLNTNDLRNNIALVEQQPFLFSGKIIDAIRMGRCFTQEEVIESAKKANAHHFIQMLPNKYETKITERGSNLSGGQIQRIAIARAILGNPSILLLDEATSALDAESESEVREGLKRAMKNRTVIVIAHRLATTQEADKIVVFDKGKIVEVGNHIDLLNKKGIYKDLCEKQLIIKI
jgi:ATP-binding cassette subfamily B protein